MVKLLKQRGLLIVDDQKAEEFLSYVNYYKLRAYFIPFEQSCPNLGHTFPNNTALADVLSLYKFDRKLRLLLCDMLERLEIAVRTQWALELTQATGDNQAHENPNNFTDRKKHRESLARLYRDYNQSVEDFAEHHKKKYPSLRTPPTWVSVEMMSFGAVSNWLYNTNNLAVRTKVAKAFGFEQGFFAGFIRQAVVVRNICSHHARLWNRQLPFPPPRIRQSSFNVGLLNSNPAEKNKLYNFLAVLAFVANEISPGHSWNSRLTQFLSKDLSRINHMGFPANWQAAFV